MSLVNLQSELRQYVAQNQLNRFFERWNKAVQPTSQNRDLITMKEGEWNALRKQERMGTISNEAAQLQRAKMVAALLSAVDELAPDELLIQITSPEPPPPVNTENTDLIELMKRKIDALQRELILVQGNDANRTFKVEEDLKQAQLQLAKLLGN